jgi:hypothetical protein
MSGLMPWGPASPAILWFSEKGGWEGKAAIDLKMRAESRFLKITSTIGSHQQANVFAFSAMLGLSREKNRR